MKSCKTISQLASTSGQFFLLKLIDQIDYVEETPSLSVFDCLTGYGYCQVRLARAGASNEDNVAICGEELTLVKRADLGLIDRRRAELKTVDVLVYGEPCLSKAVAYAPGSPLSQFSFQ